MAIRRQEVGRRGGRPGLLYYAGAPGIGGGGVAEKQPVPSGRGVGYFIRTHFPIPRHLTSLCLTASLLAKLHPSLIPIRIRRAEDRGEGAGKEGGGVFGNGEAK